MNNNTFHKKNISKVYKQIKRREISLIEYNKYIMLNNNTERNKKSTNNTELNTIEQLMKKISEQNDS